MNMSPNPRRSERATQALPQGAAEALFNVVDGPILIVQIVGEVTTAIQASANATKLVSNPTTGTSQDLCATLDITGDELGTLYGITGILADAMSGAGQVLRGQLVDVIISGPGTIDLNCVGSTTGSVKWSLFYRPLERGAYVTAAL